MTSHTVLPTGAGAPGFRHEACFYAGAAGFVEAIRPFILDGLGSGDAVLVVVGAAKIDLLRAALGPAATEVAFADMADVGRNPARIIPAWRRFLTESQSGGRGVRGVGEPVHPGWSPAELTECHRHESLMNLAFAGGAAWTLVCPYDIGALAPDVVADARRTHPFVADEPSADYCAFDGTAAFAARLPDLLTEPVVLGFGPNDLARVRSVVRRSAELAGLGRERVADLVVVVNELATNSLRHGGGEGTLLVWPGLDGVVCEVRDRGRIDNPMVGRELPPTGDQGGRGLWLVNQLCDLVQLHSSAEGTAVRVHMAASAY